MRYGMVINLRRCIGCNACTLACKQEHGTGPGIFRGKVLRSETGVYPHARPAFLPVLCNHCEDAPCAEVCPAGATTKRADGIVHVDQNRCVGCRYCMVACPFGARQFVSSTSTGYYPGTGLTPYENLMSQKRQAGVAEKCDFCMERLESGRKPACVETCPAKARFFDDLDDPRSEVSRLIATYAAKPLKPEAGTGPSVYYIS